MKTIRIISILIILSIGRAGITPCCAQSQEMQQLLLDIEKLTQMKSILSDMKTGYQIYEQGYGSISSLSKGNFDLHNGYITGLMAVSPAVRNYGRVGQIINIQASLISEYKRYNQLFRQSGSFSATELDYLSNVYSRLVSESLDNLEELADVVTANKLRMSDAERIKAIDRLYETSSDKFQFLRSFNSQGVLLSLRRSKDLAGTQTLKKLYGINN